MMKSLPRQMPLATEADPNLDVGGIDAGHKLAILSSIAYGVQVDFDAVKLKDRANFD